MIVLNSAIFLVFCFCYVSIVALLLLSPMLVVYQISRKPILNKNFVKPLTKTFLGLILSTTYLYNIAPKYLIDIADTFKTNSDGILFLFTITQCYCLFSYLIELRQGNKHE